jgi:hypothetical protein
VFRWQAGCIEENIIPAVLDDKLEELLTDPEGNKTGPRLRTLQERLGTPDKTIATIRAKAGPTLNAVILEAALGRVPPDKTDDASHYKSHAQTWFKTIAGGRELFLKVRGFNLWPSVKPALLPFCNAVRRAVGLDEIPDLP